VFLSFRYAKHEHVTRRFLPLSAPEQFWACSTAEGLFGQQRLDLAQKISCQSEFRPELTLAMIVSIV
jgi:hypothetical protein